MWIRGGSQNCERNKMYFCLLGRAFDTLGVFVYRYTYSHQCIKSVDIHYFIYLHMCILSSMAIYFTYIFICIVGQKQVYSCSYRR